MPRFACSATSLLGACLLLLGHVAHLQAAEVPPGTVYAYKHVDGQPLEMEIYFPPQHDPRQCRVPGVILFHGGGWRGGNLGQFRVACHYLASRGLVAATANYRMLSSEQAEKLPTGETRKRICVIDAKSAIRWMKSHAVELGIDPCRIVTGGGSAGGHISALATCNPGLNDPADPRDIDTSVIAYLWFNPAFSPDDSADAEIDFLRHMHSDMPPAIAFFGTRDPWKQGWDDAQRKLNSLGNTTTELWLAEEQTHSFFNKNPWQTLTLIEIDRFLARHKLLEGEPTLLPPESGEKLLPPAGVSAEQ